jgi:hypothetical protein
MFKDIISSSNLYSQLLSRFKFMKNRENCEGQKLLITVWKCTTTDRVESKLNFPQSFRLKLKSLIKI